MKKHTLSQRSLIILISLLLQIIQAQGQYTPKLYNYTTKNGLTSNEAYYVIQDSKGYIWCSTDHGIIRYNGESFKSFSSADGLTDRSVFDLFEDHLGRIWCLTYNKKLCYIQNDSIIEFPYNDSIKVHAPNRTIPLNILVDSSETIYISLKSYGILSISKDGATHLTKTESLIKKNDNLLLLIKKIKQKAIIDKKIVNPPLKKKYFSIFFLDKNQKVSNLISSTNFLPSGISKHSIAEHEKKLFFSIKNTIYSYNGDTIQVELNTDDVISLYSDGTYLWLGFYQKGLACYQIEAGKLVKKQHFLNKYSISSILKDDKGGYWFTSLDNGLFYTPNFHLLTWSLKTHSKVSAIHGNKASEIYVTHESGILDIIKNNHKQEFKLNDRTVTFSDIIYHPQKNKIYIAANMLYEYDPKIAALEKSTLLNKGISLIKIISDKHTIWFSGRYALGKKSISAPNSKAIHNTFNVKINDFCLHNDSSIVVIIEGEKGLFKYQNEALSPLDWLDDYKPSVNLNCVSKFGDRYVFGTENNGLLFVKNEQFSFAINKDSGLITNQIHCIHPLSKTELLVGTNKGITLVQFQGQQFKILKLEDFEGLLENRVVDIFSKKDSIWIAHPEGLTKFHKSAFFRAKEKDQVVLEQVWVNDFARTELCKLDAFSLPYYENRVEFKFIPNNYKKTTYWYKYKMLGEDKVWKESQNSAITYSSLNPGNYVFQISTSPNGIDYGPIKQILVYISKPFWATWWFRIFSALLVLALIYAYAQYKIKVKVKKIKAQELIKQQMFELKSVALKAQINPHFFFNVLNSLQGVILTEPSEVAYNYHNKFTQLMRLVLIQSDQQTLDIQKELKALKLYIELEQFRTADAFESRLKIDPLLDKSNLQIPSMLLQPFVENAIWHGLMNRTDDSPKLVQIQIRKKQNYIESIIEDNGVGRAKAMEIRAKKTHQHQSMGTKISHKRLALYKKQFDIDFRFHYEDLKDAQGRACGTRVLISFPYFVSNSKKQ